MRYVKYFVLIFGLSSSVCNAFFPVIDPTAIAQAMAQITEMKKQYQTALETYENAKRQYKTLEDTYTSAKGQLSNLKSLKDFNSGHYDWGTLKNAMSDLHDIQWSAGSWKDTLSDIAGGNSARYKELVAAYKKSHPTLSDEAFEKGATKTKLLSYQETNVMASNADAQATTAYDNISKQHESIHELSKKIEDTDNTKSSIDLNSRLSAENAKVQTEILKQLAILNKQQALRSSNELRESEEAAKFYTLPD